MTNYETALIRYMKPAVIVKATSNKVLTWCCHLRCRMILIAMEIELRLRQRKYKFNYFKIMRKGKLDDLEILFCQIYGKQVSQ